MKRAFVCGVLAILFLGFWLMVLDDWRRCARVGGAFVRTPIYYECIER